MEESAGSNVHVNAVTILGVKATRPSFLEKVTNKILKAKNVADVINTSQDVAEDLMRFDIFDNVQILLDNATDSDPLAAPDSINVVYQLKEKSRVFIKTGTEIGNNEGNMVFLYLIRAFDTDSTKYLKMHRMDQLLFVTFSVELSYWKLLHHSAQEIALLSKYENLHKIDHCVVANLIYSSHSLNLLMHHPTQR